jgi:putative transcriptional regulator
MTSARKPFAERLKIGLEEALSHARGELTLKTIEHPDDPPEIPAKTIVALRTEAAMSQAVFAKVLSTSVKTVQSWEQGKRLPSKATRRLIELFAAEPEVVCRVVGVPSVNLKGFVVKSLSKGRRRLVQEKDH